MIGIGSRVTKRSEMQLSTPATRVTGPSSRHLAFFITGNTQYASTGLYNGQLRRRKGRVMNIRAEEHCKDNKSNADGNVVCKCCPENPFK